ncbi:hypothetical protein DFJ74DRAFT_665716 [Hyaloraphidium curvatum]|nr:hypothetical protein DFJ74DRAFT_665716 [Hyaloraphidium curvatum]
MVAGRPELEELEVSLDESAALADKVRPRVTAWDITDEAAFRRLCNRRDFRPRRIAKTGGGPIGKKSMEALKKLPSVTSVHLAELRSDMILTAGLPESHRELEVDRLYPTLFRVPLGEEFAHDLPGDVPVPIDVRELGKPGGLSRLPREADALGAPGEERPDPDEDYSEFEDL